MFPLSICLHFSSAVTIFRVEVFAKPFLQGIASLC